jgi:predicted RNA binding protein YcfA (HicA-like mRNA interferase family)
VKVRDVIRLLESEGWRLARTRGSHRMYKHSLKHKVVVVSGKSGDDMPKGTLKAILKDAGLEDQ